MAVFTQRLYVTKTISGICVEFTNLPMTMQCGIALAALLVAIVLCAFALSSSTKKDFIPKSGCRSIGHFTHSPSGLVF